VVLLVGDVHVTEFIEFQGLRAFFQLALILCEGMLDRAPTIPLIVVQVIRMEALRIEIILIIIFQLDFSLDLLLLNVDIPFYLGEVEFGDEGPSALVLQVQVLVSLRGAFPHNLPVQGYAPILKFLKVILHLAYLSFLLGDAAFLPF